MHTSVAPVVKLDLGDGVERNLMFDFLALEKIEELIGEPVFGRGFVSILSSAKNMPALLVGALSHESPELTVADVRTMLKGKDPAPVMSAIMEAWGLSMPEKDKAQDPTKPGTSRRGSISGRQPSTI